MPQTLMLVFIGQDRETHIPVEQVEFTPFGIWSGNKQIAMTTYPVGKPRGYRINPELLTKPNNDDYDFLYGLVSVHRLMPSGDELEKALEQFETDPLSRDESCRKCPICHGVKTHACAFIRSNARICGITRIDHEGADHPFTRCPESEPHIRVRRR